MKGLVGVVALFCLMAWDISTNHGAWTRTVVGTVTRTLHHFGLL